MTAEQLTQALVRFAGNPKDRECWQGFIASQYARDRTQAKLERLLVDVHARLHNPAAGETDSAAAKELTALHEALQLSPRATAAVIAGAWLTDGSTAGDTAALLRKLSAAVLAGRKELAPGRLGRPPSPVSRWLAYQLAETFSIATGGTPSCTKDGPFQRFAREVCRLAGWPRPPYAKLCEGVALFRDGLDPERPGEAIVRTSTTPW